MFFDEFSFILVGDLLLRLTKLIADIKLIRGLLFTVELRSMLKSPKKILLSLNYFSIRYQIEEEEKIYDQKNKYYSHTKNLQQYY